MTKTQVAVFFGGPSGEYEISLASGTAVLQALQESGFDLYKIAISRKGEFFLYRGPIRDIITDKWSKDPARLTPLSPVNGGFCSLTDPTFRLRPDVLFPVLHGNFGEDGKLQGVFSYIGIPYVGCGTAASALCMNKALTKDCLQACKIPLLPYCRVKEQDGEAAGRLLGYPLFLKPISGGSSLGASKVTTAGAFPSAYRAAAAFGPVMAEPYIKGREIEVALLETASGLRASRPGEIHPGADFYDYNDKYHSHKAVLSVPADLPKDIAETAMETAKKAFRHLSCRGLARVDFFYTEDGRLLLNEINTMPGMTAGSLYPRLCRESFDLSMPELCRELVNTAFLP